jgi:hypothetical protein
MRESIVFSFRASPSDFGLETGRSALNDPARMGESFDAFRRTRGLRGAASLLV